MLKILYLEYNRKISCSGLYILLCVFLLTWMTWNMAVVWITSYFILVEKRGGISISQSEFMVFRVSSVGMVSP